MLVLSTASALAKDLVLERSVLVDPSGNMTLADVQGAVFAPAGEITLRTYEPSSFWLRLSVNSPLGQKPLVLNLKPSWVSGLTLFTPPAGPASGNWSFFDVSTASTRDQTSFVLAPGPQTVYLRVSSKMVMLQAVVQTQQDHIQQKLRCSLVAGVLMAAFFAMVVIVLMEPKLQHDRLRFWFLIHLLVCLLSYLNLNDLFTAGLEEQLQVSNRLDLSRLLVALGYISFFLLLQSLLGFFKNFLLQRLLQWLISSVLLLLAILFAIEPQLALQIGAFLAAGFALLANLALSAVALLFWRKLRVGANLLLPLYGALVFLLFVISWAFLQLMGVLSPTPLLLDLMTYRGLFFVVCMMIFMRFNETEKNRKFEETKSLLQTTRTVNEEKSNQLQAQLTFTALLMHELRSPLYTIQLAAMSLGQRASLMPQEAKRLESINRASDDINFIIDRCAQADQLEQNALAATLTSVSLSSLLRDIATLPGHARVVVTGQTESKVTADYQFLRIILVNLLSNALKYSPPDSTVQLDIQPDPQAAEPSLCFRVSNKMGSAGRPDPLKVFTRYYRNPGADKAVGTGLGLWLANNFAIKMKTTLMCSSSDNEVYFYFNLELCS